jgi:hypothetical protein
MDCPFAKWISQYRHRSGSTTVAIPLSQIPVLHPVMVRCWYIRRMLGLDDPEPGHGRLLAQMPELP